jgi:hypothetical protein
LSRHERRDAGSSRKAGHTDPSIVRDAIAELNRNEYALGRISGR